MGKINTKCRVDAEFRKIINEIKIEFLKNGKKAPSSTYITNVLAKKLKSDGVLRYDEFIKG